MPKRLGAADLDDWGFFGKLIMKSKPEIFLTRLCGSLILHLQTSLRNTYSRGRVKLLQPTVFDSVTLPPSPVSVHHTFAALPQGRSGLTVNPGVGSH